MFNQDDEQTQEYHSIIEALKKHIIPEAYPESKQRSFLWDENSLDMNSLLLRDELIRLCGYSFLCYRWIRPLANWIGSRVCLEIMGGSGALSYGLRSCGVNIHCTDNRQWEQQQPLWFCNPWVDVEKLDAIDAIRKYGKKAAVVICSWPYMDDDCYHALMAMRKANPNAVLLYIGEGPSGATASDKFFENAIPVDDPAFYKAVEGYRSAYAIHDSPRLYK